MTKQGWRTADRSTRAGNRPRQSCRGRHRPVNPCRDHRSGDGGHDRLLDRRTLGLARSGRRLIGTSEAAGRLAARARCQGANIETSLLETQRHHQKGLMSFLNCCSSTNASSIFKYDVTRTITSICLVDFHCKCSNYVSCCRLGGRVDAAGCRRCGGLQYAATPSRAAPSVRVRNRRSRTSPKFDPDGDCRGRAVSW